MFKKSEKGLSLVEVVVSLALVGGGALVLIKGKDILLQGKKAQTDTVEKQIYNENLLKSGTRLLTDTSNDDGEKRTGVCKMAFTTSTTAGVGRIFLDLTKGSKVFTEQAWKNLNDEWSVAENKSKCKNLAGWNNCFVYDGPSSKGEEIERAKMYASIEIIPVGINPYKSTKGTIFFPLKIGASQSVDAKDVSFKIVSKLHFKDKENDRTKILQDFLWAPSVGICDGNLNDKKKSPVKLSLSGSGASDPEGNTVYNRSGFTGNKEPVFSVNWRRSVAQAGITTDGGTFITTDKKKNIFGSCNEIAYRCPKLKSDKREYGVISMMLSLNYNSKNNQKYSDLESMKPRFRIKRDSGKNLVNAKDASYSLGTGNSFSSGRIFNVRGSHDLRVVVQQNGDSGKNNGVCREVCSEANGYNTSGNRYKAEMSLQLVNHEEEFDFPTTQSLGCTACYMKSCSQFGIGTFGKMINQPPQPQDSQFPECHIHEPRPVKNSTLFSLRDTLASSSSSRCVKAKLDESSASLVYETADCSEYLPVMCYNFGEFILARDAVDGSGEISRTSYNEARRRCFETGQEASGIEKLDEFLGVSSTSLPKKGGEYNFINLAQQGTFLAPQTQSDVEQYIKWVKRNGANPNEWFWVARFAEGNGYLRYLPVFAPKLKNGEKHALYYNPQGKLIHKEFPEKLNFTTKTSENATVLAHHLKFRGLYPVQKKDPVGKRKLPFLCRKGNVDGDIFLSKKTSSKVEDGGEICEKESGFFLPPTTPSQWVHALNLVNKFHPKYSFPWPQNTNVNKIALAWTPILVEDLSVRAQRKPKLHPASKVISLRGTKNYTPDLSEDPYFLMDGLGFYVDPRAKIVGKKVDGDDEIKVKKDDKFEFSINSKSTQEIEFHSGDDDKKMSLDEIIAAFNSKATGVTLQKKKREGDDDDFYLVLRVNKIAENTVLRIKGGGIPEKLGFSSFEKGSAPDAKYLCVHNGLRFKIEDKKSSCDDSKLLKHGDTRDAMDVSIAMTLSKFSKYNVFKLEK